MTDRALPKLWQVYNLGFALDEVFSANIAYN